MGSKWLRFMGVKTKANASLIEVAVAIRQRLGKDPQRVASKRAARKYLRLFVKNRIDCDNRAAFSFESDPSVPSGEIGAEVTFYEYPKVGFSVSLPVAKVSTHKSSNQRKGLEQKGLGAKQQKAKFDVKSAQFLDSWEWKELRYRVLQLYGRRCMCCGATPKTGATIQVDHIKPRFKYPELALDITNLQVLCYDCNKGKGSWDETDFRTKGQKSWIEEAVVDMERLNYILEKSD